MYVQLNCAVLDPDQGKRQELATYLTRTGLHAVVQLSGIEQLVPLLSRSDAPQLVIVNFDPAAHEALRKLGSLPRQYPTGKFFVMSQVLDPHLLMEAMHLGMKEFIPLPMSEDKLTAAIERVATGMGMGKRAKVVHVIPTIGGCGSTTIACNVAAAMSKSGKTALIDLDLMRGTV